MNNRIPWSRLLFEGVVVVISILAAFAIDAWWENRKAMIFQEEYFARLEIAFEENGQLAEQADKRGMNDSRLLEEFIHMTPDEAEQIPSNKTWGFLRARWRPNVNAQLNTTALTAMLDAGQLSAEFDPPLLTAIADWRAAVAKLAAQINKLEILSQEVIHALSFHPELQRKFSIADKNDDNSDVLLSGSVTRRVREDNEVISRASRKGQTTFILNNVLLQRVQEKSNNVLELIRRSREN